MVSHYKDFNETPQYMLWRSQKKVHPKTLLCNIRKATESVFLLIVLNVTLKLAFFFILSRFIAQGVTKKVK